MAASLPAENSPQRPLPFAKIVVIDDPTPRPAALNMAVDEALLSHLDEMPILRCYRWAENAVSFGCFGEHARVREEYPGRALVRRWTGGGIVEHRDDFTYTLLVPRALLLATFPAMVSYQWIHGVVASALAAAGVLSIRIADDGREGGAEEPAAAALIPAPFLKPCFANPVPFDLLAADRKVAGGAQRRTGRGLLHQGSIQGLPLGQSLPIAWRQELTNALTSGFARARTDRQLSPAELAAAALLAEEKYAAKPWLERR